VLAFAREGYRFTSFRPREFAGTLGYAGFWNMARKYWKTGAYEVYRSLSKKKFVEALQGLVPDLRAADIAPGGAGVRAQAVRRDGSLLDDFQHRQRPRRHPRGERAFTGGHGLAGHRPTHRGPRHPGLRPRLSASISRG